MSLYIEIMIGLSVLVTSIIQMMTDPRMTKGVIKTTMIGVAVLLLQQVVGFASVVYISVPNPAAVGYTFGAMGLWIVLGMLGLMRFLAPTAVRPIPRWILHFGMPDIICLLGIVWCVAVILRLV